MSSTSTHPSHRFPTFNPPAAPVPMPMPLSTAAPPPTRKRRLSNASLGSTSAASTTSPSAASPSGVSSAVDADGDVELGESSDVSAHGDGWGRAGALAAGHRQRDSHRQHIYGLENGHRNKRRRRGRPGDALDSALPVSESLEGMMLGADGAYDPALAAERGYTVQSPTSPPSAHAHTHQAFPFPFPGVPGGQAHRPDPDGDIALMDDDNGGSGDIAAADFGRPEVVEPPRAPVEATHSGRPRGRGWYEPEKDRIVVTSLSDSEASQPSSPRIRARQAHRSRDGSGPGPERDGRPSIIDLSAVGQDGIIDLPPVAGGRAVYDDDAQDINSNDTGTSDAGSFSAPADLAQPGPHGFTVSPSLLARLTRAQLFAPAPALATSASSGAPSDRSLIMYRPMRAAPAESRARARWGGSAGWDADGDVNLDADDEAERGFAGAAGGRIEEIDEDEEGGDVGMGAGNGGGDGGARVDDIDMEVDEGLVENVDSMEIG